MTQIMEKHDLEVLPKRQALEFMAHGRRVLIVSSGATVAGATHRQLATLAQDLWPDDVVIRWTNGQHRISHVGGGDITYRSYRSESLAHGLQLDVVYLDRVPGDDREQLEWILESILPALSTAREPVLVKCDYLDDKWPWPAPENRGHKWTAALIKARTDALAPTSGYLILDPNHDDLAAPAIEHYAMLCRLAGYTQRARGLCDLIGVRSCSECACTDAYGCETGCSWVAPNLCSSCGSV